MAKRGPKPMTSEQRTIALAARRQMTHARLPNQVIEALKVSMAENGTTLTDEIEARLVETLIADGYLDRAVAISACAPFAATATAVS